MSHKKIRLAWSTVLFVVMSGVVVWIGNETFIASGRLSDAISTTQRRQPPENNPQGTERLPFYQAVGTSPLPPGMRSAARNYASDTAGSPTQAGGYSVEVGTTETETAAISLVRTVTTKGINAYYSPVSVKGHVLFRIRAGAAGDQKQAEDLLAILKNKGVEGKIVRL